MKEELFRKQSLDKVKSPESLNDTIRVANPGIWLIIVSVILILVGACVWALFGRIENVVTSKGIVTGGTISCEVDYKSSELIKPGAEVRIGSTEGRITSVNKQEITADISVPDGEYVIEIVTESITPFSFITN